MLENPIVAQRLGIKEIDIGVAACWVYFFRGSAWGDDKEVLAAMEARGRFVSGVVTSSLIEQSKVKDFDKGCDTMPHGHPSSYQWWVFTKIGAQFELGPSNKLDYINFLNKCITKLSSSSSISSTGEMSPEAHEEVNSRIENSPRRLLHQGQAGSLPIDCQVRLLLASNKEWKELLPLPGTYQ
jgi:hypothetical protein